MHGTKALHKEISNCLQSPHGHRVDTLPYFKTDINSEFPCMYAANMKSSEKFDNNLFYWLFPTPNEENLNLSDIPLVINMNCGLGSTSMYGLFTETGPLRVKQLDPNDHDSFQIDYNPDDSWSSLGDLLYIDHPVGAGWSYGTNFPTN